MLLLLLLLMLVVVVVLLLFIITVSQELCLKTVNYFEGPLKRF